MTNGQYFAQVHATSPQLKPWDYRDYFHYGCVGIGFCSYLQVVFPVIEGAQKLTVITTSADGHHKEKEVDPKLFEER